MRWNYPIFKVFGISIELHLTFILFLLLALGDMQFFIFLTLIFMTVLAHELVHSVTALAHGVRVPKITLLPIGGLASIELPQDPMLEIKVSVVGPLFNFFLAGCSWAMLYLLNSAPTGYGQIMSGVLSGELGLNSIESVLSLMVYINFVLGAFNMVPAFPMDGGRVFRGVLALWMDYISATKIATFIGKVLFFLLALAGILTFNIWWILIGFFLSYAGGGELRYIQFKRAYDGKTLGDISSPKPPYALDSLTLGEFFSTVYRRGERNYIIVDSNGAFKKVVDIAEAAGKKSETKMSDLSPVQYSVADSQTPVISAIKPLMEKALILLVYNGRVVGSVNSEKIEDNLAG
jgi:Zn-dependent protease